MSKSGKQVESTNWIQIRWLKNKDSIMIRENKNRPIIQLLSFSSTYIFSISKYIPIVLKWCQVKLSIVFVIVKYNTKINIVKHFLENWISSFCGTWFFKSWRMSKNEATLHKSCCSNVSMEHWWISTEYFYFSYKCFKFYIFI